MKGAWALVFTIAWISLSVAGWNRLSAGEPGYAAERLLWRAEKEARRISTEPVATPYAQARRTLGRLARVIELYPGSHAAARAQLLTGQIRFAREEFDEAAAALQLLIDEYPRSPRHSIAAHKLLAMTYRRQARWGEALRTYEALLAAHPHGAGTLTVPLEMMNLARAHLPSETPAVFQQAIRHYQRAQSSRSARTAFAARQLLAGCFAKAGYWNEAMDELETLVMLYPGRIEVPLWFQAIDRMSRDRLHDPERVYAIAYRFSQRHPAQRKIVDPWLQQASAAP